MKLTWFYTFLLFSFFLIAGCTQFTEKSRPTEVEQLTNSDKKTAAIIKEQSKNVMQLIDELDLILIELQKNDELHEAIDMMETAKNEANKILVSLKSIDTDDRKVASYKASYEKNLHDYIIGLEIQIEGMENWDGQKTTKGFKKTELAKTALKQLYKEAIFN